MMNKLGQKGFTLIELLVVMGLLTVLTAMATVNFSAPQSQASLSAASMGVIGDLRSQQVSSMVGESNGQSSLQSQGIHFDTNSYTVFHGSSFVPGDPGNYVVNLDSTINFTNITFPGGNVFFAPLSGEVTGYSLATSTVTLVETNINQQLILTINRYGVVSD